MVSSSNSSSRTSRQWSCQPKCSASSSWTRPISAPCPHISNAAHCGRKRHLAARSRLQLTAVSYQHDTHDASENRWVSCDQTAGRSQLPVSGWGQHQHVQQGPAYNMATGALNRMIMSTNGFLPLLSLLHQQHAKLQQQGALDPVVDAVNVCAVASQLAKASRLSTGSSKEQPPPPQHTQLLQAITQLADICQARSTDMRPRQLSTCLWAVSVLAEAAGLAPHMPVHQQVASHSAAESKHGEPLSYSRDRSAGHMFQGSAGQQAGLEADVFQALADDTQLQGPHPLLALDSGSEHGSTSRQHAHSVTFSRAAAGSGPHVEGTCAARAHACMGMLAAKLATTKWSGPVRTHDIVQALHAYAQLQLPLPSTQVAAKLLKGLRDHASACSAQDCSLAVWSIAVLKPQPVLMDLLHRLERASLPLLMDGVTSQGLSNIAWGLAVLQHVPKLQWTEHLLHASSSVMHSCTHQELAMLAWAVPQLVPPARRQRLQQLLQQWLDCLEAELIQRLTQATEQVQANVQHAATVQQPRPVPELLRADAASYSQQGNQSAAGQELGDNTEHRAVLQPQHVACVLRCMALLQHTPSTAMMAVLRTHLLAALARPQQQYKAIPPAPATSTAAALSEAWTPAGVLTAGPSVHMQLWAADMQAQCTVLWSLARMAGYGAMGGAPPADLVSCLVHSMGRLLHGCNAQDLSSSLYALALLGYQPNTKWLVRFFMASQQLMSTCGPAQLAALLLGLARLQVRPEKPWLDHALSEVSRQMSACLSKQSSPGNSRSSVVRGRSRSQSRDQGAGHVGNLGKPDVQAVLHAWHCGPREVASLWGALGRLGYCPPASCTGPLFAVSLALLPKFNPAELAMMVTAQAKMGLRLRLPATLPQAAATPAVPVAPAAAPVSRAVSTAALDSSSHLAAEKDSVPKAMQAEEAGQKGQSLEAHGASNSAPTQPHQTDLQQTSLQQVQVEAQSVTPRDMIPKDWAPAVCRMVAGHAASMPPQHLHAVLSALHSMRLMSGFTNDIKSGADAACTAMGTETGVGVAEHVLSFEAQQVDHQSLQELQVLEVYSLASLSLLVPAHVRGRRWYSIAALTRRL